MDPFATHGGHLPVGNPYATGMVGANPGSDPFATAASPAAPSGPLNAQRHNYWQGQKMTEEKPMPDHDGQHDHFHAHPDDGLQKAAPGASFRRRTAGFGLCGAPGATNERGNSPGAGRLGRAGFSAQVGTPHGAPLETHPSPAMTAHTTEASPHFGGSPAVSNAAFAATALGGDGRFGPDGLRADDSPAMEELNARKAEKIKSYGAVALAPPPDGETSQWQGIDLPDLLLPWGMFTIVLLPWALDKRILRVATLLLCLFLARKFIVFSKGTPWKMLGWFSLISTGAAVFSGYYICSKYVEYGYMYGALPHFEQVYPSESPDAYRDAGVIQFNPTSYVDSSMSVGFKDSELWCVAPITAPAAPGMSGQPAGTVYGWWAVGTDCCEERARFRCGMATNPKAHMAMAVIPGSPLYSENYKKAVKMAALLYGIAAAPDPMFVMWTTNPDENINHMWETAVRWCQTAIIMFLAFPMLAGVFSVVAGRDLLTTGSEPPQDWEWNAKEASLMRFGLDLRGRRFPFELKRDLIEERCYWSGELLHDYVFSVANSNLMLGAIACHPAHPFTKTERLALLCFLIPLLVLVPAALGITLSDSAVHVMQTLKPLLALMVVAIPRRLLTLYFKTVLLKYEQAAMEGKDMEEEQNKQNGRRLLVLSGMVIGTSIICFLSIKILMLSDLNVGYQIWLALDWVAYAFVFGLIYDAIKPTFGGPQDCPELKDEWYFGFFGRWNLERDSYMTSSEMFLWRYNARLEQLRRDGRTV